MGCHALPQGIFLTQELSPSLLGLLHCRQIVYTEPLKMLFSLSLYIYMHIYSIWIHSTPLNNSYGSSGKHSSLPKLLVISYLFYAPIVVRKDIFALLLILGEIFQPLSTKYDVRHGLITYVTIGAPQRCETQRNNQGFS